MAYAPTSPKQNPNASWTASGAIIKELLNLSSSINLEGEITPVEAWRLLHLHPEFSRLDRRGVEALKKHLSTATRCCGYVADISVSDVEAYITIRWANTMCFPASAQFSTKMSSGIISTRNYSPPHPSTKQFTHNTRNRKGGITLVSIQAFKA